MQKGIDFEEDDSLSLNLPSTKEDGAITPEVLNSDEEHPVYNKENIGKIIDIASELVDIGKIYTQGKIEAQRRQDLLESLKIEADNYVKKVAADTDGTISKMEVVRKMMNDYYSSGSGRISGDEFTKIIMRVIDESFKKTEQ